MTTARWPARVALVAALTAPLLAWSAGPADAARKPSPACRPGQAATAPAPGRAWAPERPGPTVRVCRQLRPVVVIPPLWRSTR